MKRARVFLVLAFLVSGSLLACKEAPAPEVPPTTIPKEEVIIKHLLVQSITGPVAYVGKAQVEAFEEYFSYADEHDLTPGIKNEIIWVDTKYETAKALAAYKSYKDDPAVLTVHSHASPTTEALHGMVKEDKIVSMHIGGASPAALYPVAYTYSPVPAYSEENCTMMYYLKEEHWQEVGPAQVAGIIWDNAYGVGCWQGIEKGTEDNGWETVGLEKVPAGAVPDLVPALTRFRDAGVDYIFVDSDLEVITASLKDAERLGLLGKAQFIIISALFGPYLIDLAGVERCEGIIAPLSTAYWGEDVPGMKFMQEARSKLRGDELPSLASIYIDNFLKAMCIVEAERLALKEVSPDNIGRHNFKRYLDSIKEFDTGGICAPITMKVGDPRIVKEIRMFTIRGGEFVPISGYIYCPPLKQ